MSVVRKIPSARTMNLDYCFFFKYLLKFFFLVYLQYRNNLLHINFTYNEIILLKYLKTHKTKKSSLVSGNWRGEKKFSLTRPHSRMCIRIYIFNFKKQTKKRVQKKQRKLGWSPGEDFCRHPISGNKSIFWPNLITDQRSVCEYVTYMSHNF